MNHRTTNNGTTSIETGLGTTMNRRHLLKIMGGVGAAALTVGVASKGDAASAQSVTGVTQYKTTTSLNFRSGPGTSYPVIRIIPAGDIVAHTGTVKNNFFEVGYSGTYGWVHRDYLAPVSGGSPAIVGEAWTTAAVNLRSGPSTDHQVLRVVPNGSRIGTSNTVQNGFRYVSYQAQAGWMSEAYISFSNGGSQPETFTTTAPLNLRAEPSTSAKVLLVIPERAVVQAGTKGSGQFRQVTYKGITGWAATAYLN